MAPLHLLEPRPNHGIPPPHEFPPYNIQNQHPDPSQPLRVDLRVFRIVNWGTPRDWHWQLVWKVGQDRDSTVPAIRVLQINQEGIEREFVFWGPRTIFEDDKSEKAPRVSIGVLELNQRKRLEEIANDVPVLGPKQGVSWEDVAKEGGWNCQDWLIDVLTRAQADGIVDQAKMDALLRFANDENLPLIS